MKKLTKRIMSLMISVLLIISALPFNTISASASEETIYEYLTDENSMLDDNITVNSGVSWSSTENAAYFDGTDEAYATIGNNPLAGVSAKTGFSISVDVKRSTDNNEWARVFDFGNGQSNYFAINGGKNSNTRRFCVLTKLNGSEIRYYADGGGQGTVIYNYADFLANEAPDVWHNVKVTFNKIGNEGRVYYYIDGTLYYIYGVSNYDAFLDSFSSIMQTYYIGKGFYSADGTFKGYIKNLRISKGINDETRELFHYTFDNGTELGDEQSASVVTLAQSYSDPNYQQFSDHIWLRDGWMYSHINGLIRDVRYNKNWRIDFSFTLTNSGIGANRLEHILGISNILVGTDFGGIKNFGVSSNGKVYFNTNDFDNGALGDTGVNLKDYFFGDGNENRQKPMKLSYAYNNGVICVLMNDELKCAFDVSANADFFENIQSITIGGRNGVGNWIDIFDLDAYSYQRNDDISEYLVGQFLVNNTTTNEVTGSNNLTPRANGAEWTSVDDVNCAHFLGENSSDSPRNNILVLEKTDVKAILSGVDDTSGLTISFASKAVASSWQRIFDFTNADNPYSGGDGNDFMFMSTNNNIRIRTSGTLLTVNQETDVRNWHVWTIVASRGALTVYKDGALFRRVTNAKLSSSWFNQMVNNGMIMLGASTYNDPGYNGYIRDFRVYNCALRDSQVVKVYGESGQRIMLNSLNNAASAYVNKIKTATVYNNTKAAYDAYVKVNRMIDAVTYGNTEIDAEKVAEACSALTTATNNLTSFSRSFSVPSGSDEKWASHDTHGTSYNINDVYHNVLWSSGVPMANPGENDYTYATAIGTEVNTYKSGDNKNSIRPVIYRESAVLVYTGKSGDDPYMPIMFRCRGWRGNSGTFTQRHRAVYIASNAQGMYLNNKWRGTDGQLNYLYTWFYHGEKNVNYVNNYDMYNEVSSSGSGHKAYYYSNVLRYNGSNQFSSNQYSKTVNNITWGFNYSNNNDTSNASQTAREGDRPSDKSGDSNYDPTNRPIYVINYAAVLNSLSSAATYAKNNITNYKEGGLSDFFARYDEATAFNPADYGGGNWESDISGKVTSCANDIGTVISNLNNVSKTADAYNDLRNEMSNSHNGFNAAMSDYFNENLADTYTASSITTFKEKYEKAANEMAMLVDNPYKSTVASTLSALSAAHHALTRKADFSTILDDYAARIAYSQSEAMNAYTTESVEAFREALASNTKYAEYSIIQQNETPYTQQSLIDAEIEFINNGSSAYLDSTKSLAPLSGAYEMADDLLMDMNNAPAQYTWAQLEPLVEAIEKCADYLNATAEEKREFGTNSHGSDIDAITQKIVYEYASISQTESLDLDVYNALWDNAQSVDSDAYDYPAETLQRDLNTYRKFVWGPAVTYTNISGDTATINVVKSGVSSATIDAAISILQSSFTNRTRMYSINIANGKVSDTNGITFTGGKYKEDKENGGYLATYGTKMTLNADSPETAWYMEFYSETASRNEQFQDYGKRFSTNVFGNINISVKSETDGNKVTVLRAYDDNARTPVNLVDYVDGSFTVPAAPALPYYTFAGYTLNGEPVSAGDVISVNEDITIIANYEASEGLPFAINIEGEDGINASYNDYIGFTGNNDTYAWLEKVGSSNTYKPFYIGRDVSFFATETKTLKPVSQAEFDAGGYSLPWVNLRQSGVYIINNDSKKKVTFNGQFVTDGNADITEYGVLLGRATNNGSISASDVVLENIGASEGYTLTRFKSTKDVGAHQFTIAVNGLSGDVIYKGYISYVNEQGITVTVYTDAFSETI